MTHVLLIVDKMPNITERERRYLRIEMHRSLPISFNALLLIKTPTTTMTGWETRCPRCIYRYSQVA